MPLKEIMSITYIDIDNVWEIAEGNGHLCAAQCPPQNYYPDYDTVMCRQCPDRCLECTSLFNCQKCLSGLKLADSRCVSACQDSTHWLTPGSAGIPSTEQCLPYCPSGYYFHRPRSAERKCAPSEEYQVAGERDIYHSAAISVEEVAHSNMQIHLLLTLERAALRTLTPIPQLIGCEITESGDRYLLLPLTASWESAQQQLLLTIDYSHLQFVVLPPLLLHLTALNASLLTDVYGIPFTGVYPSGRLLTVWLSFPLVPSAAASSSSAPWWCGSVQICAAVLFNCVVPVLFVLHLCPHLLKLITALQLLCLASAADEIFAPDSLWYY